MRSMPRVSDEYLLQRRRQILDAARACFMRNGFHATSMQDVIAEAGLSVGAVYRYFKSKNEIVAAIAEETIGAANQALAEVAEHEPPLPLAMAMERAVRIIHAQTGADGLIRVALPVWAEALRDPVLAEFVAHTYRQLRDNFVRIARQAQRGGELGPDADPEAVGSVLFGLMPGYALQRVLIGEPTPEVFLAGITALLEARSKPAPATSRPLRPDRRPAPARPGAERSA
jgi:AcrR family transcriptional regulator